MAFLFKRKDSPYFWCGWYNSETGKSGKPFSTKTKVKREAETILSQFEKKLERAKKVDLLHIEADKILTLSEAFELYKQDRANTGEAFSNLTIGNYDNALKYFIPAVGDKEIYLYGKTDYHTFIHSMDVLYRGRKISQNTKAVYSKCIYALFQWLLKEKYILENPMKRVREEQKEFKIISDDELTEIRKYAKTTKFDKIITFMILSAFRANEAICFKYSDIQGDLIKVKRKGSKFDSIIILPEMREFLKTIDKPDNINAPVFGIGYDSLHRFWLRMKESAKIRADVVPHDLRKYCLSKMANAGKPINFVQQYAGHTDMKTTLKYYIRNDKLKMIEEMSKDLTILGNLEKPNVSEIVIDSVSK